MKLALMHFINDKSWSAVIAPRSNIGAPVRTLTRVFKKWGIECAWHPTGKGKIRYAHIQAGGRPILVISSDNPESIRDWEVGSIWIDEGGAIPEHEDPVRNVWAQIPGRLRCPKAKVKQIFITTTHEGTYTWCYKNFIEKPKPGYRSYIGSTYDNPVLKPEDIEMIRSQLPAGLEDQYLRGQAVDYTANCAHPDFNMSMVRSLDRPENPEMHIGCDFNVQNMSWILGFHHEDGFHVEQELVVKDGARVDATMMLAAGLGWNEHSPIFHPDPSSKNRKSTGNPEWMEIISTAKKVNWQVRGRPAKSAPRVRSRIDCVNGVIKTVDGIERLTVDPSCENLIKQLRTLPRTEDGGYPKDQNRNPDHLAAALGYTLWDLFKPQLQSKLRVGTFHRP